jgi:hypothetical protein
VTHEGRHGTATYDSFGARPDSRTMPGGRGFRTCSMDAGAFFMQEEATAQVGSVRATPRLGARACESRASEAPRPRAGGRSSPADPGRGGSGLRLPPGSRRAMTRHGMSAPCLWWFACGEFAGCGEFACATARFFVIRCPFRPRYTACLRLVLIKHCALATASLVLTVALFAQTTGCAHRQCTSGYLKPTTTTENVCGG